MSQLIEGMNPAQAEAITAPEAPVLVIAGPGSGKTRVLTHRVAYLLEEYHVPASGILAVTFTNKAAREMEARIANLVTRSAHRLTVGTFHSICARILRRESRHTPYQSSFTIYDTSDQRAVMKQIIINLQQDPKKITPASILAQVSSAKNELLTPAEFPIHTYKDQIAQRAYEAYQNALIINNAMDFDDLLVNTVRLFQNSKPVLERYQKHYMHLLVDEFQDTNTVQYELVRLLSLAHQRIFVVGDPDQSIYAFRGADYRNVKRFETDYDPVKIFLEENYRSHQGILDAATSVIRHNHDHISRKLYSARQTGEKIVVHEAYDDRDEADFVVRTIVDLTSHGKYAPEDFAIMYRMNAQSRSLEESFIQTGLPYVLVGATRFYARKEIKDALAYMRVVNNPHDWVSMSRIINVPPRGIGKKTIEDLMAWSDLRDGSIWEALEALHAGNDDSPLGGRSKTSLNKFTEIVLELLSYAEKSPMDILDAAMDETGYWDFLHNDQTPQGEERRENIAELKRVAGEDKDLSIGQFLEKVALVADVDTLTKEDTLAPTMLTLHSAKGLEFPVVFIVGMEEGLIPHWRAAQDPEQMAEERRLIYVGITRAKDRLFLLNAFRRMKWGTYDVSEASHFLDYLPSEVVAGHVGYKEDSSANSYQQETTWNPYADKIVKLPTKKKKRKAATFRSGQQIVHPTFGDGIVVKSTMMSDMEEVEVVFAKHGQKRIMADFLEAKD